MKSNCLLCGTRKSKRACPALGREICPSCCATKRLVEIACPPDCGYLSAARAHPAAVVQRQQDRDMRFVLPRVGDLSAMQYRLFMVAQAVVLEHARSAVPAPHDADVADAAGTAAATLETAGKGIIYEHQAVSIPAQRLATEISRAIAEVAQRAGAEATRIERNAAIALRRLERAARDARAEIPDAADPSVSWMALATRMMGAARASAPASPPEAETPRIVL